MEFVKNEFAMGILPTELQTLDDELMHFAAAFRLVLSHK